MSVWFWLVLAALIVGTALLPLLWADDWGAAIPAVILSCVFGIAAVVMVIWAISLHYDRATCHAWAKKTGRESKFAYYNAFSWDCLARAHDGKWVPKEQIGDFNK